MYIVYHYSTNDNADEKPWLWNNIIFKIIFLIDNSVESLELDNVEIMIADCRYLSKIKNKLNNIKWIQSISAGVEQLIELRDDKNINFVITRFVDDVYGLDMAEYIVMQIVAHERRQKEEYEALKSAVWPNNSMFVARRLISQMNIGIMGVGNIGKVGKY